MEDESSVTLPRGVFAGRIFVVEFSSTCQYSEKVARRQEITSNGGTISYILNKKV